MFGTRNFLWLTKREAPWFGPPTGDLNGLFSQAAEVEAWGVSGGGLQIEILGALDQGWYTFPRAIAP